MSEFTDDFNETGGVFNEPWAALSHISLDGQGAGSHANIASSDGDLDPSSPFTYKVLPDGLMKIFVDPQNQQIYFPGAASPDANYFAISLIDPGDPGIGFGIKYPDSAPAAAARTYWAVQYANRVDNPGPSQTSAPVAMLMNIILNADGTGYHSDIKRSDCAAGPDDCSEQELEEGPFTYEIDDTPSNGNLTISFEIPGEGTFNLTGIVSQDGTVFTVPFLDPSEPGLMVGIQKPAGDFSMDKAKGKYYLAQTDDSLGSCENPPIDETWPWAGLAEIVLDGQGNGTFKDKYSTDMDDPDFPESGTFTYTVNANGELTIYPPEGGASIPGIISADGSLFVMANIDPCYPGIAIGIKASPGAMPAPSMLLLGD